MKKCPFCAEEIQDEAIKCRFCGEFLDGRTQGNPQTNRIAWYYKNSTLVLGFVLFGPLIIPLILLNPRYSGTMKIVLVSICIVISIFLYKTVRTSLVSIDQYYQLIQGNY